MAAVSQNGWPLLTRGDCVDVPVPGGVLPTHPRLTWIAGDLANQWHFRVEPLQWPGCWGYAGPDRFIGGTRTPSNHWSGSAWDLCAPQHPQGVATRITFTARELAEVTALEQRYAGVLIWGGRWVGNSVDAMHWEVVKGATLEAVDALSARIGAEVAAMSNPAPPRPPTLPVPPEWTGPDLTGTGAALRGAEGNSGPRVAALQQFWATRYPAYAGDLAADGWWGPATTGVCREFARRTPGAVPSADGLNVGPQLARKLFVAGFRG